jgi:protein-disulfide isomerase
MAYENEALAIELGVRQAPTLVVVSNGEAVKYAGVAEVKKFIEAAKGAAI